MDEYHAARVGSESDAILVVAYSNRTLSLGDFVPFADAGTTPSAKHQSSVVVSAETSDESQSAGSSQPTVSKRPAPPSRLPGPLYYPCTNGRHNTPFQEVTRMAPNPESNHEA